MQDLFGPLDPSEHAIATELHFLEPTVSLGPVFVKSNLYRGSP
jgi:hypothetical protein